MDVALVRWPTEDEKRSELALGSVPRLLLLEDGAEPPDDSDCLEDWVRLPASEADLHARIVGLTRRADRHGGGMPTIDEEGVLAFGSSWVPLPAVEAHLARALLDRYGRVVSRDALVKAAWVESSEAGMRRNALDVRVLRLRRRIEPLGLSIRTIRSRGYALEASSERAAIPT